MLSLNGFLWGVWGIVWFVLAKKVNKTQSSESPFSRALHLVPTVVAFYTIFNWTFFPARLWTPCVEVAILGNVITAAGVCFAIWARVHLGKYWSGIITLKEGHRLIRTGPYRFARHPIYTGMLSGFVGSILVSDKISSLVVVLILAGAYIRKMRMEEKLLTSQFGEEYLTYKREVKMIIPGIL
jgi:protein-S-isoprenylcysteine O-methyltransferase Ste14